MNNNRGKSNIKTVRAFAVIRTEEFTLYDDACGDSKPFYPLFKTKNDAKEYKDSTYGKATHGYWAIARVVPCEVMYALPLSVKKLKK